MLRKLTFWLMRRHGIETGTMLDIREARLERDRWEARCADLVCRLEDAIEARDLLLMQLEAATQGRKDDD